VRKKRNDKQTPRSVLVTGASSGIGRALALEYARRGAHVFVTARREAELASLCADITAAGGRASKAVCDVADTRAAYDVVRAAEREMGSLDMVIANAGIGGTAHAVRFALDDVMRMFDVNVKGAVATLASAIPIMLERKQGHLVGVSSLAGRRALPASAAYSASKAALSTFLEGLRIDLAPSGIGVTDVQPGFVETPLTDKNEFSMPFMWPVDKAARYIADRLERAPRIVAFPLPLAAASRLSQFLPFWIHAMATRWGRSRQR
jgi:NADP-dependent 3-hydroxy acid dehydrogenase YdfG